eukprot:2035144-Rhodomonas_salina.14
MGRAERWKVVQREEARWVARATGLYVGSALQAVRAGSCGWSPGQENTRREHANVCLSRGARVQDWKAIAEQLGKTEEAMQQALRKQRHASSSHVPDAKCDDGSDAEPLSQHANGNGVGHADDEEATSAWDLARELQLCSSVRALVQDLLIKVIGNAQVRASARVACAARLACLSAHVQVNERPATRLPSAVECGRTSAHIGSRADVSDRRVGGDVTD